MKFQANRIHGFVFSAQRMRWENVFLYCKENIRIDMAIWAKYTFTMRVVCANAESERERKAMRNCNSNILDYFNLPECTLPFGFFLSFLSSSSVCLSNGMFFLTSLFSLFLPDACVIEKSKWWNRLKMCNKYSNEKKTARTRTRQRSKNTMIGRENKMPTNVYIA